MKQNSSTITNIVYSHISSCNTILLCMKESGVHSNDFIVQKYTKQKKALYRLLDVIEKFQLGSDLFNLNEERDRNLKDAIQL